jgi:hypothetical protein
MNPHLKIEMWGTRRFTHPLRNRPKEALLYPEGIGRGGTAPTIYSPIRQTSGLPTMRQQVTVRAGSGLYSMSFVS